MGSKTRTGRRYIPIDEGIVSEQRQTYLGPTGLWKKDVLVLFIEKRNVLWRSSTVENRKKRLEQSQAMLAKKGTVEWIKGRSAECEPTLPSEFESFSLHKSTSPQRS